MNDYYIIINNRCRRRECENCGKILYLLKYKKKCEEKTCEKPFRLSTAFHKNSISGGDIPSFFNENFIKEGMFLLCPENSENLQGRIVHKNQRIHKGVDKSLWKSLKQGPVPVEIINSAPQGNGGGPDAENNSRNEGKDGPPEREKQKNQNHLAGCFDFSKGTCGDYVLVRHGHQAKTVDAQFPGQDQNHHPRGYKIQVYQHDQRGKNKKLISHGINEFSEIGDLLMFSGQMSIKKICETGEGEKENGGPSGHARRKVEQQDNDRNT